MSRGTKVAASVALVGVLWIAFSLFNGHDPEQPRRAKPEGNKDKPMKTQAEVDKEKADIKRYFELRDERERVEANAKQEATDAKQKADAEQYEQTQRLAVAVMAARELRNSMRNPDSFKLEKAIVEDDGSTCYVYRAQNGFGGLNVGHAVLRGAQLKTDEMDGFETLWNKACANKSGANKTDEVDALLP